MKKVVQTQEAPGAVGPYSQAVVAGGFVWVSGQIPLDPRTGALIEGDIEAETRRVLANVAAVLEAAGSSLGRVVRATVYLTDLGEFARMNRIYAESFPERPPARVTVEVSALPKGARIEIDAVALA
jgi:2-iminobutanoate/2-iminopropanoate deaminase